MCVCVCVRMCAIRQTKAEPNQIQTKSKLRVPLQRVRAAPLLGPGGQVGAGARAAVVEENLFFFKGCVCFVVCLLIGCHMYLLFVC